MSPTDTASIRARSGGWAASGKFPAGTRFPNGRYFWTDDEIEAHERSLVTAGCGA